MIKDTVSEFLQEISNRDILITVTRIVSSHSARKMFIHFSVFPTEKEEEVASFLKQNEFACKEYLKKNAKLRHVPSIEFVLETENGTVAKW